MKTQSCHFRFLHVGLECKLAYFIVIILRDGMTHYPIDDCIRKDNHA